MPNTSPLLFFTPQHWAISDALATHFQNDHAKSGVFVITGQTGTGKTTLLRKIIHDNRDNNNLKFVEIRQPDVNFVQFVDLLNTAIPDTGGVATDAPTAAHALKQKLIWFHDNKYKCVVVIDNAHKLSPTLFQSLYRLVAIQKNNGVNILLVGNNKLDKRLESNESLQLGQLCFQRFQLDFLTLAEVRMFFTQCLNDVLAQKKIPIDISGGLATYWYSKGNPHTVQSICRKIQQILVQSPVEKIDRTLVEKAAAALSLKQPDIPFPENIECQKKIEEDFFINMQVDVATNKERARPKNIDPMLALANIENKTNTPTRNKKKKRKVRARTSGRTLTFLKFGTASSALLMLVVISAVTLTQPDNIPERTTTSQIRDEPTGTVRNFLNMQALSMYRSVSHTTNSFAGKANMPNVLKDIFEAITENIDDKKYALEVTLLLSSLDHNLSVDARSARRFAKAQQSIAKAQVYKAASNYVFPTHASAYSAYREALMWDPESRVARQGINDLHQMFVTQSEEARKRQDWTKASQYFNIALNIGSLREIY